MIENLSSYFSPKQEIYLNNISYNIIKKNELAEEYNLTNIDNAHVDVYEDGINLTIERVLEFEPEGLFRLSVSFGANLQFVQEKKSEIDWEKINLAQEFIENGDFITVNLFSRISLLISQITSAYGQPPIITPPMIKKAKK